MVIMPKGQKILCPKMKQGQKDRIRITKEFRKGHKTANNIEEKGNKKKDQDK